MAGWPTDGIGQPFRQPVSSLPKCPISSPYISCSALFLCRSSAFCCRHAEVLSCDTFLCPLGVLCSAATPNSLPLWFHLHQQLGKMFFPVPRDAGHPCRNPDSAGAAGPFWEGGQDPWIRQSQTFTWLLCLGHYGGDEELRGERRHFPVSDWNLWDFPQNLHHLWWYSDFTKQRFGEILMLLSDWVWFLLEWPGGMKVQILMAPLSCLFCTE